VIQCLPSKSLRPYIIQNSSTTKKLQRARNPRLSRGRCCISIIPEVGWGWGIRWKDCKVKASLGYIVSPKPAWDT
jgi:hypothetical protein